MRVTAVSCTLEHGNAAPPRGTRDGRSGDTESEPQAGLRASPLPLAPTTLSFALSPYPSSPLHSSHLSPSLFLFLPWERETPTPVKPPLPATILLHLHHREHRWLPPPSPEGPLFTPTLWIQDLCISLSLSPLFRVVTSLCTRFARLASLVCPARQARPARCIYEPSWIRSRCTHVRWSSLPPPPWMLGATRSYVSIRLCKENWPRPRWLVCWYYIAYVCKCVDGQRLWISISVRLKRDLFSRDTFLEGITWSYTCCPGRWMLDPGAHAG